MSNVGNIIKEHRIRAGFTQNTLAAALHVTDKAISKWERGICLPDVTLMPKLSLLLDVDLEFFISKTIEQNKWVGLIDIQNCDFSQIVYDKPLAYYLLSHYLLLGITEIHFITDDMNKAFLDSKLFCTLGFRFSFDIPMHRNMMILNHPWFLFGSDLTEQFQGAMLSERKTKLVPTNQEPVFFFSHDDEYFRDKKHFCKTAAARTLGRGMICLDMGDPDKLLEVASFIQTYQRNSGLLIGSLEEIAFRRGDISAESLLSLAAKSKSRELLIKLPGKLSI